MYVHLLICPSYTDMGDSKVELSSWIWIQVFLLHVDQKPVSHIICRMRLSEPGNSDRYPNFFLNAGFGSSQSEYGIRNLVVEVDFIFHYICTIFERKPCNIDLKLFSRLCVLDISKG